MKNKVVIYKIVNLINNKIYVGSSVNFDRRKREHWSMLKLNKHSSKYLQNSFNKYGKSNFKFEIIETCSLENIIKREQFYIDTLFPEYNTLLIAGNTYGYKHTEESKDKISQSRIGNKWCTGRKLSEETKLKMGQKNRKSISQYDLNNKLIKSFESISQASKITNIAKHCIRDCVSGKTKTGAGYVWSK